MRRYVAATDDTEFERGPGLELLVETARLWRSLGHHDAEGRFRIDGVTGPDEYTALVDNNVFTNLMAARNLASRRRRRQPTSRSSGRARHRRAELATWRAAADAIVVPFDEELGVTAQSEGFTRYRHWNFAATDTDEYPLLLHYPYYLLYSSQVVKQADLVFALYVCGDCFSAEQKRRDFDYYEPITVRDSSLSASIQAIVAAEVGHLDLAYDYFRETALIDLHDRAGNTADGLHLASLAGALARRGRRLRRPARSRRHARLRATPSGSTDPALLPSALPRPTTAASTSKPIRSATSSRAASRSSCSTTARQ